VSLGFVVHVLDADDALFTDGLEDGALNILLVIDGTLNIGANLAIGQTKILARLTAVVHQRKESIIDSNELVVGTLDVGHVHVVSGGADILELLAGEQIDGDEMDFGVTVLARLRCGHLDDLAGAALDHDVAALPEGRALHGEGLGGAGISRLEVKLIRHLDVVVLA